MTTISIRPLVFQIRTELEIRMIRTHVITSGKHAFHHQRDAHRVEQSVMLRNAVIPVENGIFMHSFSTVRQAKKQDPEKDVSDVRENVVEIADQSERVRAEEIVVAQVLISRRHQYL